MATERFKILMINPSEYKMEMARNDADFGHPKGVKVGQCFKDRDALWRAGVHKNRFAGISVCKRGANAIVLSGGYEDDEDNGDEILYTGTGGQVDSFSASGHQVHDQSSSHRMNLALQRSCNAKLPVRVIRGYRHKAFAPAYGYRYDGLYRVTEYYSGKGQSGHTIWRFKLVRMEGQPESPI
ncbi:sra-ydg domain-containing protein [Moniliophthora roreri]|nr:sra-ydg domain-containing protein [Moniliophthora roreri]